MIGTCARALAAAHQLGQLEAVHLRHLHVEERQRDVVRPAAARAPRARARRQHLDVVAAQQRRQREQVLLEVVDEQALDASARRTAVVDVIVRSSCSSVASSAAISSQRQHDVAPGAALQRGLRHHRRPARCPAPARRSTPPARCTAARPAAPSSLAPVRTMPSSRVAVDVGGRFEQHVDRRPREVHRLVDRQREPRPAVDQQVVVGRREVDRAGLDAAPCPRPRAPAARTARRKMSTSRLGRSRGRCSTTNTGGAQRRRQRRQQRPTAPRRRRPRRRSRRASTRRASGGRRHARVLLLVDALVAARARRRRRACAEKRSDSLRADARGSRCGTARRGTGRRARSCSSRSK